MDFEKCLDSKRVINMKYCCWKLP